jgi:hypothetical protein
MHNHSTSLNRTTTTPSSYPRLLPPSLPHPSFPLPPQPLYSCHDPYSLFTLATTLSAPSLTIQIPLIPPTFAHTSKSPSYLQPLFASLHAPMTNQQNLLTSTTNPLRPSLLALRSSPPVPPHSSLTTFLCIISPFRPDHFTLF